MRWQSALPHREAFYNMQMRMLPLDMHLNLLYNVTLILCCLSGRALVQALQNKNTEGFQ